MKITELSIKKPVAIIMITIGFVLIGLMGYSNLGSDLMPDTNLPFVTITTIYPGAGATEVENDVIKPIEDAVSGLSGIDKVYSTAGEGYASVVLAFTLSTDSNTAMMDTQKAVDSVVNQLPSDATKPVIKKIDEKDTPILVLTLSGDKSPEELYASAKDIKERVETVQGVGNVSIFGGKEKELIIKLDKLKLDYYGLSISRVAQILQAENINIPGGTLSQAEQDKIVRVEGEFTNIDEIKDLRIATNAGYVKLSDIADVSLEYSKIKEIAKFNGKSAVGLSIMKQNDANIVQTGKRVKDDLAKLQDNLNGAELRTVVDTTTFITSSLNETQRTLWEGIIITGLILFLFLRQLRSVIIVMLAIPTSLISTYFMMYVCGFTLNMLSLMGLSLCIGILVDDSIVVLENIHRHLKMGKDPEKAALDGRNEIGMAAIAITLSDVVVFAPIAFMSGIVGQYFRQFGLTVVFATLMSLLVSFTLTPMLASKLFKEHEEEHKKSLFGVIIDGIGVGVKEFYISLLKWSLKNRWKVIGVIVAGIIASFMLFAIGAIPSEFMPYTDEGTIEINVTLNQGASIEKSENKVNEVEKFIKTIKELDYYYIDIGSGQKVNTSSISLKLVNKKDRHKPTKQVVDEIREWGKNNLTGVSFVVSESQSMGGGRGAMPVQLDISGKDLKVLKELANKVETVVKNTEGIVDVENSIKNGNPEISVNVDRLAASTYGFTAYDVSNVVRASIEGTKAGVFRDSNNEDFDIRVKVKDGQIVDENDLKNLNVTNAMGSTIKLGQIANIEMNEGPTIISKTNREKIATIGANIKNGYTLGTVVSEVNKNIAKINLPEGYKFSFSGETENMDETFTSLLQVLVLSLILVYMILVILYESFLTPFVRILALPVASIGALGLLALTGETLNMLTMIGFIMLDGLAAKNGTILIDYTNTLMSRGYTLREALVQAVDTRLKPIWMTSVTMMVGMVPNALALGDGAEFKAGMAIAIIGGILTSTILSPILLPIAYTLLDDMKNFFSRLFKIKKKVIKEEIEEENEEEKEKFKVAFEE